MCGALCALCCLQFYKKQLLDQAWLKAVSLFHAGGLKGVEAVRGVPQKGRKGVQELDEGSGGWQGVSEVTLRRVLVGVYGGAAYCGVESVKSAIVLVMQLAKCATCSATCFRFHSFRCHHLKCLETPPDSFLTPVRPPCFCYTLR